MCFHIRRIFSEKIIIGHFLWTFFMILIVNFLSLFSINVTYVHKLHSYDILGARMLWKPKEARILKNLKNIYRSTSVIW